MLKNILMGSLMLGMALVSRDGFAFNSKPDCEILSQVTHSNQTSRRRRTPRIAAPAMTTVIPLEALEDKKLPLQSRENLGLAISEAVKKMGTTLKDMPLTPAFLHCQVSVQGGKNEWVLISLLQRWAVLSQYEDDVKLLGKESAKPMNTKDILNPIRGGKTRKYWIHRLAAELNGALEDDLSQDREEGAIVLDELKGVWNLESLSEEQLARILVLAAMRIVDTTDEEEAIRQVNTSKRFLRARIQVIKQDRTLTFLTFLRKWWKVQSKSLEQGTVPQPKSSELLSFWKERQGIPPSP